MNKQSLKEIAPFALFFITVIFTVYKIPYALWAVALSGFLLGLLYVNLLFWLRRQYDISKTNRIIAMVLFGVNLIACSFCFIDLANWQWYCLAAYVALGLMAIICLFNSAMQGYMKLLYRCIFFMVVLTLIYAHQRSTGHLQQY